jgi:precorrin-6B methylase 2/mono/diheme cytochrome c family protein
VSLSILVLNLEGVSMRSATKTAGAALLSLVTFAAQSPPMRVEGDPIAGKALFEGRGECVTCHSLETPGRRLGPGLNWIGMLRPPESLRRALVERHPSMPSLSAAEIDHLVAYLRTLRSIPPSEPRERTREIPTVSENVAFFNRPEREVEERSEALVKALEIREGATIADIGAGTGYFTWRLARYAGPTGKVIAVDIQQRMLDLTAETVRQHGLVNVDYVLGRETDPRLPPGSLDMVFIAHSYHEFSQPETIMEAIRRSLKPQGRLVVVEYAKERKLAPAAPLHKMSFDEIREEIEPLGFDLERILDFLPVQHGLIFTVR